MLNTFDWRECLRRKCSITVLDITSIRTKKISRLQITHLEGEKGINIIE